MNKSKKKKGQSFLQVDVYLCKHEASHIDKLPSEKNIYKKKHVGRKMEKEEKDYVMDSRDYAKIR